MKPLSDRPIPQQVREYARWPQWRKDKARLAKLKNGKLIELEYTAEPRGLHLIERYGKEIGEWLLKRFEKLKRSVNDSCDNNYRVGIIGKEDDHYEWYRMNSCCGYSFHVVKWKDGTKFRIGMNHGH